MNEKPVRVLNVNDRDIPRYIHEETLRRAGYEVRSVATGAEALAAARESDVVLLDVQLPDIDGFEVCRRIKRAPETSSVIVLLSSAAFMSSADKVVGLDAGADGYLVQPYESAELFATLRALVRGRTMERRAQALAEELTDAIKRRDQFLAMLGHELRNPLASITTAVHLLQIDPAESQRTKYVGVIARQTTNLTRLVDDLLDVARITQGKITLERAAVDLRLVVERCVQSMSEEVRRSQLSLELDVPQDEVFVMGDVVRLDQILSNLITNAIKYTPSGGHIQIRVSVDGATARLEVQDTGIGMSAQLLARAFDVFVQSNQALDRSRGGLGLGLAVVRQLVELHGGEVHAHSDGEGKGSRLVVDLPRPEHLAQLHERGRHAAPDRPPPAHPTLDPHSRHQCVFYADSQSRVLPSLVAVIRQRLAANYRCMYFDSPAMVDGLRAQLCAAGTDVDQEVAHRRLVLSSDHGHLIDGVFQIDPMIEQLQGAVREAIADGHTGLFATGDMMWEFGPKRDFSKLLDYERRLEQLFSKEPALCGICQYRSDLMPREAVRDGLLSHKSVFISDTVARPNPDYVDGGAAKERRAATDTRLDAAVATLIASE